MHIDGHDDGPVGSLADGVTPDDVGVRGESSFVSVGDVTLHVVQAGPDDGPLVVLLHGFPEFWYGWADAVAPLADAGYRVAVPDQRGYHLSEKPRPVSAYGLDALAGDVVGLVSALGRDEAALVGHDWGASVAWWTALHHPEHVSRLAALNVPHPTVFRRTLRRKWTQRLRSWYMAFFQVPLLPEAAARLDDWHLLVSTMRRSSRPGTFSETDFERYRVAWSRPDAYRSMVNWYRAAGRERPRPATDRVEPPTLVLWGCHDDFLETSMARASADLCADGRAKLFYDATHWLHHEEPIAVADELRGFLAE